MDVAPRIREFINQEILFENPDTKLDDDTLLLEGLLDSVSLLQLVAFLEDEFGVEIDDTQITSDNFKTVADIESLVRSTSAET